MGQTPASYPEVPFYLLVNPVGFVATSSVRFWYENADEMAGNPAFQDEGSRAAHFVLHITICCSKSFPTILCVVVWLHPRCGVRPVGVGSGCIPCTGGWGGWVAESGVSRWGACSRTTSETAPVPARFSLT
ncbi:hypothetical protein JB92DRAFT_1145721 [Gautieria morchelliformis]|nr:hypothetical protein JB92DRAFT_1145721 [Gautieria morchelliformis]